VVAAPLAHAGGIYGGIFIHNNTQVPIFITSHLDSANCVFFIGSNGSHWDAWPTAPGFAPNQPDGSPPAQLGPGQQVLVISESNDGLCPSGTGGNMELGALVPLGHFSHVTEGVGTLVYSVPGGCSTCNPQLANTFCSSSITPDPQGSSGVAITGGYQTLGPAFIINGCTFDFPITGGPATKHAPNRLDPGQGLSRGVPDNNSITATGNKTTYTLQLGDDGNLVDIQSTPVTLPGPHGLVGHTVWINEVVWSSHTNNASVALMQDDGNFVLLDPAGNSVWQSNTAGNPGASVTPIGNDLIGNALAPAVMGGPFGGPLWSGANCGQSFCNAE